MIYNTTDGTPWLIREIYEYIKEIFPLVETAVDSVLLNFIDDKGFMTHEINAKKVSNSWEVNFTLETERDLTIEWDGKPVEIESGTGSLLWNIETDNKYMDILDHIKFRTPVDGRTFPMTQKRHALKDIILNGEYQ